MNVPINPDLLGTERLANESARAYRAFCLYRDFGPGRSIDRTWQRLRANQQKEHGAAMRRPGHWASWATRFHWVNRADAHDDLIDKEKRTADAERRRKLQEQRSRFELEDQSRMEKRVLSMDDVLDRLATAPQTEVTQVKRDEASGKKTTTKIKALSGREVAVLTKARNETARQTIQGYDIQGAVGVKEERVIDRIVWRSNPNFDSARQDHIGSRSGNRQGIANMDADPEAEEDKAA
jgi:hypothetical protein